MRKVGLFFGTFDPIHIGHEKIAIYFLERYFDEIWFVITPLNPDKINENLTDQSIRLEMGKNFCDDNEKFKYCDIEFNFPFGFKELEGIHSRTDFDLANHEKFSGIKIKYFDSEKNQNYVPYVIETSI